ncbi:antA/AntB antirepressor family protein [uncultured Fusobacterium sp.]|uniref:antA/AntB antirepressor family protein n=1 Tax=uncultured Fusobacterium sp. TaxID=159267 RepID=UPI0025E31049|nr:antA/AntB antirepressor family protein [uncultured Fusobacterium sp.]
MNNLIKIQINDRGEQLVSGRDLHEFLEIGTQFSKWFDRMCEYGFSETKDYIAISQKRLTAQGNETTYTDYLMKISMAKELSMLQRNEIGKQAREYFIKCEEAWNSEDMVLARAFQIQNKKMIDYKEYIQKLENKVDRLVHSNKLYTATEIAKELGFKSATALNKELEARKIQYKMNGTWVLSARYSEAGYTSIKQNELENGTIIYDRKWTGLGRDFLIDLFNN